MTALLHVPVPKLVDGFNAVPIRITNVTGSFEFDATTQTATASAVMEFDVGPHSGFPIFDIRQTIQAATFNGSSIAVSDLAHHDFGPGNDHALRIINRNLMAGSSHVLTLAYALQEPQSPNARDVIWLPSGALSFDFHLSDLNPARYLESWLPSNLLFDQFPVTLDIALTGAAAHTLISNGSITQNGSNTWTVAFPAHFAPCSHMLMIEADSEITQQIGTVNLSGGPVALELTKRATDADLNLNSSEMALASFLTDMDGEVGPYMHGDRYVAYLTSFNSHSMEYDGATTSRIGALEHEVFHSWWARGLIPATGEDGWLDEAWTTYMTTTPDAAPLDMTDPPVAMWQNDPWRRNTNGAAYGHGSDVFSGIAAEIGIAPLQSHMAAIYNTRERRHFSTPLVEAELIRRSGSFAIADIFDRFVYGGNTDLPGSANLHLRDAIDDTGAEPYTGMFWRSPDVWVRNSPDGGTTQQPPEAGQDNWLYARVTNRGSATARSFVVGWKMQVWAGTQFEYPGDWLPLTGAAVGFDLAPGASQIVCTKWPASDIPPEGTHGCLLAMVWCADDRPVPGRHVWEEDTLAQRNMTVVDEHPDEWEHRPFRIGSRHSPTSQIARIELHRPRAFPELEVLITHKDPARIKMLLSSAKDRKSSRRKKQRPIALHLASRRFDLSDTVQIRAADGSCLIVGDHQGNDHQGPTQIHLIKDPRGQLAIAFDPGHRSGFDIALDKGEVLGFELCFRMPNTKGKPQHFNVVQFNDRGRMQGGFTIILNNQLKRGTK
ncbi:MULTISPECIES: hypothetical protein [unclassified Ruegeria]|uniref:hypothetical protein n=1 Tax=unclassified Ruegeria TaxID=2625375 RepID=UPI0014927022|nr:MULTISPECIES: hypothetical protein [unclassified Ruegeria]NOD88224.1 hypothetical protein [Ruegeria sp. HKCCD4318]NOE13133.1 hypothetical protein [Ruegeria sp. HKCCD4318-2]NOG11325.1 hypothetical protein [Ruegeria sp. HKCCD4315]